MSDETPFPSGELMAGRRGVVMGVANKNSIAWSIAQQLKAQGAEVALTYVPAMEKRVAPLAEELGAALIPCDVTDDASMDEAFAALKERFGGLDFLVHAIAYADRELIKGSFVENTTRAGFAQALDVSAYSFVDCCRRAGAMMEEGGSIITLTYLGSERVIPSYNVMGVAKAALEASTRYAARDLGKAGIRVNAISAGAIKTLSLGGIAGGRSMIAEGRKWAPLREDTDPKGVAGAALYLLSDLGKSCTGEVLHVDAGFHIVGMPEADVSEE
jgi:enoyl-[acyl-carrier protein] reductase I